MNDIPHLFGSMVFKESFCKMGTEPQLCAIMSAL